MLSAPGDFPGHCETTWFFADFSVVGHVADNPYECTINYMGCGKQTYTGWPKSFFN